MPIMIIEYAVYKENHTTSAASIDQVVYRTCFVEHGLRTPHPLLPLTAATG